MLKKMDIVRSKYHKNKKYGWPKINLMQLYINNPQFWTKTISYIVDFESDHTYYRKMYTLKPSMLRF